MKAWLGILGIFGVGAGVGFFVGERYGRKKAAEEAEMVVPEPESDEMRAETIITENGYASDENDISEADTLHPEDDEPEEEDKHLIEILFDEDQWDFETEYDCHELFFYEEDGVVCDEDEHVIHDPEELIGENTIAEMNRLGVDVIFAKNHWNESFYKIVRIENAYGRAVLGLDDNYAGYHDEDDR